LPNALRHTLFIAVPLLAVFAVLPGVYQNHLLLFNFVIFLILAQGVNIIYGFTGYLPFGYVGFFGAGAYGFAILVMHYQAPAPFAVIVAGLVGVALGLLLTPLLRLSGAYFAIANLAASLAVLHFVANPALENITRGPYGVSLTGTFNPTLAYTAALVVLALTLGAVVFLKNSRFGLALQAVREDAVSASMAGVNVVKMRVIAWLASALVAGLAGGYGPHAYSAAKAGVVNLTRSVALEVAGAASSDAAFRNSRRVTLAGIRVKCTPDPSPGRFGRNGLRGDARRFSCIR